MREHALPALDSQSHLEARNYTGYRVISTRNAAARGVLFGYFNDAPHVVRFGQELFAAADLVKHLDQHQRSALDALGHDFPWSGPLQGQDLTAAQQMYLLARQTFLDVHRIAGIENVGERMTAAAKLTRRAYCEAAHIPTPGLGDLPWWRDILLDQREELGAAGIAADETGDGRLSLRLPEATFAIGSAELPSEAREALVEVAQPLATKSRAQVLVEGHTDPLPIVGDLRSRYPTNLELGYARAAVVRDVLIGAGFPAERISVTSLAATEPPPGAENPRRAEVVVEPCGDVPSL